MKGSNTATDENSTKGSNASDSLGNTHDTSQEQDGDPEILEPNGTKIIIVMGMTGTGKSSFIKLLTKNEDIKVGEGLNPETSEIRSYQVPYDGNKVALVDTPGFDDDRPHMSDTKLLGDITTFLVKRHKKKTVHGFIYFHRISDNRVGGTATRNIRMFSSLCGPDAMKNVVIVTTRWDEVRGEKQVQSAEKTESELFSTHFKGFTLSTNHVHRHDNTISSARRVMSSMIKFTPIGNMQVVVDTLNGMPLPKTGAGRELTEQLVHLKAHYDNEIVRLCDEFDASMQHKDYQEEIGRLQREVEKVTKDQEKLHSFAVVGKNVEVTIPLVPTWFGSWFYGKIGALADKRAEKKQRM